MFRKGKSADDANPKEKGGGIETEAGVEYKEMGWRLAS